MPADISQVLRIVVCGWREFTKSVVVKPVTYGRYSSTPLATFCVCGKLSTTTVILQREKHSKRDALTVVKAILLCKYRSRLGVNKERDESNSVARMNLKKEKRRGVPQAEFLSIDVPHDLSQICEPFNRDNDFAGSATESAVMNSKTHFGRVLC